jgi:hypothetical protein
MKYTKIVSHISPKLVIVCFFLLSFSGTKQQKQDMEPVFGVAFGYNQMNEYYHLVAYQRIGENLLNKRILRRDDFIYYFSGFYPSKYNPTRINYFDKYGIFGGVYVDSISNEKIPYCPSLDSLWKIRYSEYPALDASEHYGWSNDKLNPSPGQMEYLKNRYNIKGINNEYIMDKHFIQLLRDATDSLWIENYKSIQ